MPGFLLHFGAVVQCAHQGLAQPSPPMVNPRVTVSGQPTVILPPPPTPYLVACPLQPVPCATAQFVTSATRLTSNGLPLLLQDSQATCVPTGTPLTIVNTQKRVIGT